LQLNDDGLQRLLLLPRLYTRGIRMPLTSHLKSRCTPGS
jgi:hypothetical protein